MDFDQWIRNSVKCCACEASMAKSKNINICTLNKEATWEFPVWSNILVQHKHPEKRAIAIVCDECIKTNKPIKYAVEAGKDYSNIKYHLISELKKVPEITEKEVTESEKVLYKVWSRCPKCNKHGLFGFQPNGLCRCPECGTEF